MAQGVEQHSDSQHTLVQFEPKWKLKKWCSRQFEITKTCVIHNLNNAIKSVEVW